MVIVNASSQEIEQALNTVNAKYAGNVAFNRYPEFLGYTRAGGEKYRLTLRVISSREPGHRRGFSYPWSEKGKRLTAACWHVHGDFFDALMSINPKVEIKTAQNTITVAGGNWQDRNIGSQVYPLFYSEACDCE